VGDEVCAALIAAGLVHDPADLYTLTADDLAQLDGFKEKRIANVLASIAESKTRPLGRLLFALGIRHVGEKAAQVIAATFQTMDALLAASAEEIGAIPGVGPVIGASLHSWLADDEHRALIERLRAAGVRMTADAPAANGTRGPLSGQSFLLTGRLNAMTRSEAENALQALGATIASGVSKSLTYLIVGADPGSKLAKAEKLKIQIRDEDWLLDLLANNGRVIQAPEAEAAEDE
jgi:DNA ligase (NAD+)